MQKLLKTHRSGNGAQKQDTDTPGTALHTDTFCNGGRGHFWHHQIHQYRRYQEIHHRRKEQIEELYKLRLAALPHHQRGDVTERTEGTAGICCDDDIDKGK